MDKKDTAPVSIENLKKSYGEQRVLQGITLQAAKGETLAILGRSGTGKSVLLRLIVGLQPPDSGAVRIEGEDIVGMDRRRLNELRKKMGFLFQQGALYDSLTVEENVAFPLSRHTRMSDQERGEKARELLGSVGMEKDLRKLPSEISGGMQKRVGLARALALDPEIVLFDEPTAGLDPITAAEIGKLIMDLKKQRGLTAIVVTHDVRGARQFADRLVLMDQGRVVIEGSFGDLQKSGDGFVRQFMADQA